MRLSKQRTMSMMPLSAVRPTLGRVAAVAIVALLGGPVQVSAHTGDTPTPETIWTAWNWDPVTLTVLLAGMLLYWRGTTRIWQRLGWGHGIRLHQALAFAAAMLVLIVAIVSPLDALAESLFSVHMIQHLFLILVAAPLLVIARPLIPVLRALPPTWRGNVARVGTPGSFPRRVWNCLTTPAGAWVVHGFAIWFWHVPLMYDAAIASDLVHTLEHATFVATGVLFWWSIIPSARSRTRGRHAMAVLSLFTTAFHTSLLAALITFSESVWYVSHTDLTLAWGLTPLEDQQLAGVIMWLPMGTIYAIAAAVILAIGLQRMAAQEQDADNELVSRRRSPELG